jgi:hypothetical protein
MKISSIFPLLAALTATVRAELATGNYYINSMVEERYYLSVYDKSDDNIQKRIKLREEKPDEPASRHEECPYFIHIYVYIMCVESVLIPISSGVS